MNSPKHYQALEQRLHELLAARRQISEPDRSEVLHFVDVGEYALALETLVGSLIESHQALTAESELLVRELLSMMELTDSPILSYLDQQRNS